MRADQGFKVLPLLALSLSFTAGIGLASFLTKPIAVWLVLASAGLLILVVSPLLRWVSLRSGRLFSRLRRRLPHQPTHQSEERLSSIVLAVLCLVTLFLGAARYQAAQPTFSQADLAWYNDREQPVELVAVVREPPEERDTHIQLVLSAEQIVMPDGDRRALKGQLLANLPTGGEWHYGDRLRVWGELQTPPENEEFSYQAYLARQGVYSYMPFSSATLLEVGAGNPFLHAIYTFRETGLRLITQYLPDPEASLLAGIVLGVESGIPDQVDQAFKDTGTTHIIAISGFKMSVIRLDL